ncbi:hypothetical protein PAPYR_12646 [Paratrimastix pyriformis]|uniref:Uncharacterized protein n=1 Tax=Paratrimastix pyriformis TaxID=342808 RepID=A0ABQ8U1J8_9EUKA|nr:hypothetical protein PAPYR_12646 [Paratrimastix pyriformis]
MSDENYCNATPYCFKTIMRSLQKVKSKIQDFDKQYQTMVDDAAQSLTFLKTINYEESARRYEWEIIIQWSSLFNKFSDSNDLHTLDIRENLELNKFFEEN